MKRWQIVFLIGLAVAFVGGAGYMGFGLAAPQQQATAAVTPVMVAATRGDVKQTVTAPGELLWTGAVNLSLGADGQIAEVYVRPGDWVEAGDVLIQLKDDALQRAVAQAELGLGQAQLGLEQLQEPPDEADVRQAEHAVDQAAAALKAAQLDLTAVLNSTLLNETLEDAQEVLEDKQHRYQYRLEEYEKEGIDYWYVDQAQEQLDDARLNLDRIQQQGNAQLQDARNAADRAQQSYQEAEDNLKRLLEGADPLDVEAARLSVEAVELVLEQTRDTLAHASLVAPSDGVVLDVNVVQGQTVNAGFGAGRMANPCALELYATIIEEDYAAIQVDLPVEVFFDALPEHTVLGRIARIVPEKIEDERPLYAVYIELEEIPAGLAEGMTADAEIIIDSREDVLRLPRSLVKARSDGSAKVIIWVNDREVERTVQTGLRGDVYIEILDGLQEGDLVVGQ